jgi:hypothetical protein
MLQAQAAHLLDLLLMVDTMVVVELDLLTHLLLLVAEVDRMLMAAMEIARVVRALL